MSESFEDKSVNVRNDDECVNLSADESMSSVDESVDLSSADESLDMSSADESLNVSTEDENVDKSSADESVGSERSVRSHKSGNSSKGCRGNANKLNSQKFGHRRKRKNKSSYFKCAIGDQILFSHEGELLVGVVDSKLPGKGSREWVVRGMLSIIKWRSAILKPVKDLC